ncbi:hypothetical protein Gogos_021982 [Gossypium gossypioides]|nr:hypothetical protein [Gossypium gossypioides]
MGLPVDTMKARLKDKNGPYISWSNIGLLWERPAVINNWHCLRFSYTS